MRRRTGKDDKRFRILELTASGKTAAARVEKARGALAPLRRRSPPAQAKQLGEARSPCSKAERRPPTIAGRSARRQAG